MVAGYRAGCFAAGGQGETGQQYYVGKREAVIKLVGG